MCRCIISREGPGFLGPAHVFRGPFIRSVEIKGLRCPRSRNSQSFVERIAISIIMIKIAGHIKGYRVDSAWNGIKCGGDRANIAPG